MTTEAPAVDVVQPLPLRWWRQWTALDPAARRWLIAALWRLPLIRLQLRLHGYKRTLAKLESRSTTATRRPVTAADIERGHQMARLAAVAGRRGPVKCTCLPQALVLHAALRDQGLPSAIRIGVLKSGWSLDAHAWVELAEVALGHGAVHHRALPHQGR